LFELGAQRLGVLGIRRQGRDTIDGLTLARRQFQRPKPVPLMVQQEHRIQITSLEQITGPFGGLAVKVMGLRRGQLPDLVAKDPDYKAVPVGQQRTPIAPPPILPKSDDPDTQQLVVLSIH
jgi:hypothetical protein